MIKKKLVTDSGITISMVMFPADVETVTEFAKQIKYYVSASRNAKESIVDEILITRAANPRGLVYARRRGNGKRVLVVDARVAYPDYVPPNMFHSEPEEFLIKRQAFVNGHIRRKIVSPHFTKFWQSDNKGKCVNCF